MTIFGLPETGTVLHQESCGGALISSFEMGVLQLLPKKAAVMAKNVWRRLSVLIFGMMKLNDQSLSISQRRVRFWREFGDLEDLGSGIYAIGDRK